MHYKWDANDPQNHPYLRYSGDGIADLIVGAAFMGIGLFLLSDLPFVPVWLIISLMPVSWALKKWITIPRLTLVEAESRLNGGLSIKKVTGIALIAGIVLFGFVLAMVVLPEVMPGLPNPYLTWGMIGLSLAGMLIVVALMFRAWRYAFYAVLVIPFMALIAGSVIDFPQAMIALGAFIFLSGLFFVYRFVATHPRPAS